MTLREELDEKVREFARDRWGEVPDGYAVPAPDDLTFGNTGRRLNACILYADIRGSTKMVDALTDTMAAEYYKAFLHCAAKVIKSVNGLSAPTDKAKPRKQYEQACQCDSHMSIAD